MKPEDVKFDEKLNMDTATPEKIAETNEHLVDYMKSTGESVAAEQIEGLIDSGGSKNLPKGIDPNTFKLLTVNKKILGILEKIQRDMFDEQDTSIKSAAGLKTVQNSNSKSTRDSLETLEDSSDFDLPGIPRRGVRLASNKDKAKNKKNSKSTKKTSRVAESTKSTKSTKKLPKKAVSKGVGGLAKGALRFARVLGPVGLLIGAGMAISDGMDAWENAGEELDMTGELSTANKAAAAAGGVISGLTFGLADSANASKGINNLLGGNAVIKKYESMGIIDHDTIGDSEITNWKKLGKLKPEEIQEIINIDDWDSEDKQKMGLLKMAVEAQPAIKAEQMQTDENPNAIPKIDYKMKNVPTPSSVGSTSFNPDDYQVDEIFKFHKTDTKAFESLEPNVLSNIKAMGAEYLDTHGDKIQINSAFRSFKEQEELKDKLGDKAAAPGKSMHNYGLAIDMNTVNADKATQSGLFKKYGFTRPVQGETWHVEPSGIDRAAIRSGVAAAKTANDTMQYPPSSEKQESEKTPEDVAKEKSTAVKSVSTAKVTNPIKTSELETDVMMAEKTETTPAEVNRDKKEKMIQESAKNLAALTASYDKGNNAQEMGQVTAAIIKNNINNVEPQKIDKIISAFSS